jgi:hypothetical protein
MLSICVSVISFRGRNLCAIRGVASRSKKSINESIVFIRKYVSDAHRKMRVCLADLKAIKPRSGACRARQVYGFSERPRQVGVTYEHVAGLCHRQGL